MTAPIPHTRTLHQHHPVYTLGKRGLDAHLRGGDPAAPPASQRAAFAAATAADVSVSPRGGEATWHGPGQAVIYPVLALRPLGLGARAYVEALEDAMVAAAGQFAVPAAARVGGRGPGAWVGDRKVGAVGVRIARGVASHGVALNACPDLAAFDAIVPCGEDVGPGGRRPVTSLDEELRRGYQSERSGASSLPPLVTAREAGAAVVAALVRRIGWEEVRAVDPAVLWAEAGAEEAAAARAVKT
jgi:lipoyl(octanoyl) transferase 2